MTVIATPRLLVLETSGKIGQVALAHGGELGSSRRLDQAQKHARDLAPTIAALLAEAGWKARDLQGIIVSRGPGSYTGLRVGIMSAKTLAYAMNCPLIAIDTFDAIAAQVPVDAGEVEVIADAQQDRIYIQSFGHDLSGWAATSPLAIRPFAEWWSRRLPNAWLSGPGLARWETHLPGEARLVETSLREPQPVSLVRLGLARLQAGDRDDPMALEPLYLRPSSAEEQWTRLKTS